MPTQTPALSETSNVSAALNTPKLQQESTDPRHFAHLGERPAESSTARPQGDVAPPHPVPQKRSASPGDEEAMMAAMGFGAFSSKKQQQLQHTSKKENAASVGRKQTQNPDPTTAKISSVAGPKLSLPVSGAAPCPMATWSQGRLENHKHHYGPDSIYGNLKTHEQRQAKYVEENLASANRPRSSQSPGFTAKINYVDPIYGPRNRYAGDEAKYSSTTKYYTVVAQDGDARSAFPYANIKKGVKKV